MDSGILIMAETFQERAKRIKGYFSCEKESDMPKFCRTADGFGVEPKVVHSVAEYIEIISKLETSTFNPAFYHGYANANYYMIPTVMRGSMKIENRLFDEFRRRFPSELKDCERTIEKLSFMQHYGLNTRCLDLTESPLVGLYFAVSDMVKFREEVDKNKNEWGEVVIIRLNDEDKDDLKYFDSSTLSVIANIAKLPENFILQQVQLNFLKDFQQTTKNNYVYFRDIIRRSVIVRTKQDNPRIINQRGAFILVNANEITDIYDNGIYGRNNSVSAKQFMDYVLHTSDDISEMNLLSLQEGFYSSFGTHFKNTTEWDFRFKKLQPYDLNNSDHLMRCDPFDLRRMLYRTEKENQLVVLISPSAKTTIKKELGKLGITEDFIYPELDSVSYALNNAVKLEI